jgi:acetyl-CoA C-acetyltransferase
MRMNAQTAVIGSAILAPADPNSQSLEELLYAVTQSALKDAGIGMADVDGIVVAANDQMDGRAISVMAASGSVGGVDRDILSTPSAAEHAFVMGTLRIASRLYRTQLVVSWSPTEAHSQAEVERLAADPYFHRRLPLDDLASFALQATALAGQFPGAHQAAQLLAGKRRGGARRDPRRWPLTADMTSAPVTAAVAVVLASQAFVDDRGEDGPVAWLQGLGWATEPGFLGDRDLSTAPALASAARQAFGEEARPEFDLAEIFDATPYQQLLALEGLGLSSREQWLDDLRSGAFDAGGRLPVNPSGGAATLNAVYCNGLIRIAEAAAQLRGRAGAHQIAGARNALAHAASGFAMQYQTVVVLGKDIRADA